MGGAHESQRRDLQHPEGGEIGVEMWVVLLDRVTTEGRRGYSTEK